MFSNNIPKTIQDLLAKKASM